MRLPRLTRLVLRVILMAVSAAGLVGCSTVGQQFLFEAPSYGYVPEVKEPGVRGQIIRVSPEDLEVLGRLAISPDGAWIVCSARPIDASRNPHYELYKLRTQGGGAPIKLTSGSSASALYPSFSADGEWIVFSSGGAIWKMRSDGAGARVKITGSGLGYDCCGQVSPDGTVAFTSLEQFSSAAGMGTSRIPARILLAQTRLIWTVAEDGGQLTQFREGDSPVWAPDGKRLAFSYEGDIWMMDSDGRNLTQLTNTVDVTEGLPTFSPDGKELAFVSNAKGPKVGTDFNIWVVSIETAQKRQITQLDSWDSWPIWHPEGICFISGRGSSGDKVTRVWMYRTPEGG